MTRKGGNRKSGLTRSRSPQGVVPDALNTGAYRDLVGGIAGLLEEARRTSARAVNAVMTTTYWEIGRRIVEHEQARGGRRSQDALTPL